MVCALGTLAGCDGSATLSPAEEETNVFDLALANVEVLEGTGQEGTVASVLPEPVVVRVSGEGGAPVAGVEIEWSFEAGRGMSSSNSGEVLTTMTDADGVTRISWELGTGAGAQRASAQVLLPNTTGSQSSGGGNGNRGRGRRTTFQARAMPSQPEEVQILPEAFALQVGDSGQAVTSVLDGFGNVITDANVSFRSSDPEIARVESSGLIIAEGSGTATVDAQVQGLTATTLVQVIVPTATTVQIESGSGQSGVVGTALGQPAAVRVLNAAGEPVSDVTVEWTAVTGGGTTASPTSRTDANGLATVVWVLGPSAGAQSLRATVAGLPYVEFSATAAPGALAALIVSPTSATLGIGGQLLLALQGEDAFGNTVPSLAATWSSSDTGIASVTPEGIVTALASGAAQITATQGSVQASATIRVQAEVPEPSSLELVGGDAQTAPVGSGLAQPLRVRVLDAGGQPIQGVPVGWSVIQGGGSVSNPSTSTDADGVGSVSWTLGGALGVQQVRATVADLTLVFSSSATVGSLASLTLTPAVDTLQIDDLLSMQAVGQDAFGNTVPGLQLSWTSSNVAVAAVAAGTVTAIGGGNTVISAQQDGIEAQAAIHVLAAQPAELLGTGGDGQTGVVGQPLPSALQVQVRDASGRALQGVLVFWTVTQGNGSLSASSSSTNAQGVASMAWTVGQGAGAQSARASLPGAGSVDFSATAVAGPLASISLAPADTSVTVGGSYSLRASGADQFGNPVTGLSLTWSSSDGAVASMTQGTVDGIAAGQATLTASEGGVSASASVTVGTSSSATPGAVSDLTVVETTSSSVVLQWTQVDDGLGRPSAYALRYATPTMNWGDAGATQRAIPGSAIGQDITFEWSDLDPSTAYEFQLIAFRETLNVDAVFGGLSNVAAATTDELQLPSGAYVHIEPDTIRLAALGATGTVPVEVRDSLDQPISGYSFGFESLNPSVVEVDTMGRFTARAVGTAMLVASTLCCSGTDTLTIVVDQDPATIEFSQSSYVMNVGDTARVNVEVRDANGNAISDPGLTWSIADPAILSIRDNFDGSVTASALSEGTTTVEAEVQGVRGDIQVTVTNQVLALDRVEVSPSSVSVAPGESATVRVTGFDADNNVISAISVDWSSNNPSVAQVTPESQYLASINGGSQGSTTVSVTATAGGVSRSADVSVTVAPQGQWNEPAGLNTYLDIDWRNFAGTDLAGNLPAAYRYSERTSGSGIRADAANGLEFLYAQGHPGGSEPDAIIDETNVGGPTYYRRMEGFGISANWLGHSSGINKVWFFTDGRGETDSYLYLGPIFNTNELYFGINTQGWMTGNNDSHLQHVGGRSSVAEGYEGLVNLANPTNAQAVVRPGERYDVEILVDAGTPGNADGSFRMWMNGILIMHFEGVAIRGGGEAPEWSADHMAPTWGGVGGSAPEDMFHYLRRTYVSSGGS